MDLFAYSLENEIEKINNKQTQKYFNEVIKSYFNNCYRSATVMLWSVIVTDAVLKLRELRDNYNDESAEKILLEIKKDQEKNPTSSKWERRF